MINPRKRSAELIMDKTKVKTAPRIRSFISRYFRHFIAYEFFMMTLLFVTLQLTESGKFPPLNHNPRSPEAESPDFQIEHVETTITKRWGAIPKTEHCNKQERIATLLSVLLGFLAADQWYAHHWVLAVFKMLTLGGLGFWWCADNIMWSKSFCVNLCLSLKCSPCLACVLTYEIVIGGVYGTPGCPGGYGGT